MRVTNKTRVEGSIVEATIAKEIGTFAKYYFAEKPNIGQGVQTSNRTAEKLLIFDTPNRLIGSKRRMTLSETDFRAAHDYVILNCSEICEKYMGYNLINFTFVFENYNLKTIIFIDVDIL